MWYVVQVYGGREENTAELIKQWIPRQFLTDCYIPVRERERKFHGKWNFVREVLFPGYIFVESSQPEKLFEELKRVPKLTRLLGGDGGDEPCFIPLEKTEAREILKLGDENHVTGISKIRISPKTAKQDGKPGEDGEGRKAENRVEVLSGPLKGKEGRIARVNLHRREAVIRIDFMGRETEIFLGIETIGDKSPQKELKK